MYPSGATSSTFIWSRNGLHSSSDIQAKQQAGTDYTQVQTSKPSNKCKIRGAKIADLNEKWIPTKALMADLKRDLSGKKQITREMTETGTALLHVSDGQVGNVAVGIGGTLVSPPLSVSQVEHYFEVPPPLSVGQVEH